MLGKGLGAGNWSGLRPPIIQPPVDIVAARGYAQYPVVPLTRASVATYVTEGGLVATAAAGEHRYDWSTGRRALLVEGSTTNKFLQSGDMSSGWTNPMRVAQSVDVGSAPDGGNMRTITTTEAYGGDAAIQQAITGIVGVPHDVSVFVRRDQNRFAKLNGFGNGGSGIAFDLVAGTYKINSAWTAGGIDLISDDIARIWGILTPALNGTAFLGMSSDLNGLAVWSGGERLSFWGAQITDSAAISSVIVTGASPITRAADVPSVDLAAGTYDVEVVTDAGTTTLLGVVHAGGAYWPLEAVGSVYSVTAVEAGSSA